MEVAPLMNPLENASNWTHITQLATATGRRLRRWIADSNDGDLADMEILLLFLCAESTCQDGYSQVELASALGVSPAQTSGLVERLRKDGLLSGGRSNRDRRRQVWHATDEGESRLFLALERLASSRVEWQQRFSPERLAGFIEALELLADEPHREQPPRIIQFPGKEDRSEARPPLLKSDAHSLREAG